MRAWRTGLRGWGVAVVTLALVAAGCQKLTPEEELIQVRAKYEATLTSFSVTQVPLVVNEPAAPEDAVEGVEEAEPAAANIDSEAQVEGEVAEGEAAVEPVPVRQDVTVDVTIRHESDRPLDGITVDFYMSDGENEINNWKVWFDTVDVYANTPGVQFSHTFEDIDYQEGHGFAAEIVSPVPASDRSQYREFSEL